MTTALGCLPKRQHSGKQPPRGRFGPHEGVGKEESWLCWSEFPVTGGCWVHTTVYGFPLQL